MSDDSDGQRPCRRGVTGDVELDAAMALADMAGAESQQPRPGAPAPHRPAAAAHQVRTVKGLDSDPSPLFPVSVAMRVRLRSLQFRVRCCFPFQAAAAEDVKRPDTVQEGTVLIPGIGRYEIGSHYIPDIGGLDHSIPAAANGQYLPGADDTWVPNPGFEVPNPFRPGAATP